MFALYNILTMVFLTIKISYSLEIDKIIFLKKEIIVLILIKIYLFKLK